MELNCLKSKDSVKQQFSTFLIPRPPIVNVQHNIHSILAKIFSLVFLIWLCQYYLLSVFLFFINRNWEYWCIKLIIRDSFCDSRIFCMIFNKNNTYSQPRGWEAMCFFSWLKMIWFCTIANALWCIIYKLLFVITQTQMWFANVSANIFFMCISLIYRAEEGVENYKVMFFQHSIFSILFLLLIRVIFVVMFFLYPHEIMHLIFRHHIAILFVLIKYKQMNHCIELSWNYVEGLAEFVMIIFSPSSPLRGSTCVCQGKPLSVMWSFLSGGRWSWVKTAR